MDEDRNPALGSMSCCDLDGRRREQCECKCTAGRSSDLLKKNMVRMETASKGDVDEEKRQMG